MELNSRWRQLLTQPKCVVGMIHLPALPGAPRAVETLEQIAQHAVQEAAQLIQGGIHAIMMENFYDVPFAKDGVDAVTMTCLTRIASDIRRQFPKIPLGINVLRNDAIAALAVALASDADFIRVNVLSGARVTDQGLIQGCAYELMRKRAQWRANHIAVMADVDVKHSAALAQRAVEDEVEDTVLRGLADAVIVSGAGTGKSVDLAKVERVSRAAQGRPVFLGSGVTKENVKTYHDFAKGYIVGTAFKSPAGRYGVDPQRVAQFMGAV
jgi:uncharacterized protein